MQREKPVTVLVSCFRFPINSLKKNVISWELPLEMRENTVLRSSFSRRMN